MRRGDWVIGCLLLTVIGLVGLVAGLLYDGLVLAAAGGFLAGCGMTGGIAASGFVDEEEERWR